MPKTPGATRRARIKRVAFQPVSTPRVDVGSHVQKNGSPTSIARRQRMALVTALFHSGFSYREIAKQTGITAPTIRADLARAETQYQLSTRLTNSMMRLDAEAVPLAVDHLIDTLDTEATTDAALARRDAAMYKTLEGRGAFRTFGAEKGVSANHNAVSLQVQFSAPPGMMIPTQQAQIVGVARAVQEPSTTTVLPFSGGGESGTDTGRREALGQRQPRQAQSAGAGVPEDFTD